MPNPANKHLVDLLFPSWNHRQTFYLALKVLWEVLLLINNAVLLLGGAPMRSRVQREATAHMLRALLNTAAVFSPINQCSFASLLLRSLNTRGIQKKTGVTFNLSSGIVLLLFIMLLIAQVAQTSKFTCSHFPCRFSARFAKEIICKSEKKCLVKLKYWKYFPPQ